MRTGHSPQISHNSLRAMTLNGFWSRLSVLLVTALTLSSCQGMHSDKPPIHPNLNMDYQDRFNAQEKNTFFADGRAMRAPVEGTVARGGLRHDTEYYQGVDARGALVAQNPMPITKEFVYRGKDRYDIYCAPCHGGTGDGQGIIMTGQYGYVPAPNFHSDYIRQQPDGHFYGAIANGIRSMPAYNTQIKVEDRWAIVAYIRALQKSQNVQEREIRQFDVDLAALRADYVIEQERLAALEEAKKAAAQGGEITVDLGQKVFTRNACGACHSIDGSKIVGPTLLGLYGSNREFEDGTTATADDEYIYTSIVKPMDKIVKGYLPQMVPYDYLPENELRSLIEYIKTLQPATN